MKLLYSASAHAFYDTGIHEPGEIPSDAVEITKGEHDAVFAAQQAGKVITADTNGKPVVIDPPPPSAKETIAALEASITPRMLQEAVSGSVLIISTQPDSPFHNMTSAQAIAAVRTQIATLRSEL